MDFLSVIRSTFTAILSSLTRNVLAVGVTWLVSRDLLDRSVGAQTVTAGTILVVTVAWSLVEKYILARLNLEKIQVALSLPAGSSVAHLDEAMRQQREAKQ